MGWRSVSDEDQDSGASLHHARTDACLVAHAPCLRAGLEARVALLPPALRATCQLQPGVLEAPLGDVTISFALVVGASALMAWDRRLASEALQVFQVGEPRAVQEGRGLLAAVLASFGRLINSSIHQ